MTESVHQPLPRLAAVHAVVFAAGVLLAASGLVIHEPYLLIVAGPCLMFAGVLVGMGVQISLAGPLGSVLRAALGRTRVATRYARALAWILAGILVSAWGLERVRAGEHHGPPVLQDPTISDVTRSKLATPN